MPHDGSACATALNPLIASPNQNECSSETARSNCACTAGLHEVGKLTVPRRSGACAPARGIEAPSPMATITIPVPTASVRVLSMATSVPGAFHTALRVRKGLTRKGLAGTAVAQSTSGGHRHGEPTQTFDQAA